MDRWMYGWMDEWMDTKTDKHAGRNKD